METIVEKPVANERWSGFAQNPLRPLIEAMAVRIAEEYRPEQIILYGSQATGKARPESDIDFFVVKQTTDGFFRRCASVKRLLRDLRGKTSVSPIVLTPEEAKKRLERRDQFIEQILDHGVRLL